MEEVSDGMLAQRITENKQRIEELLRERDALLLEARRRGWTQKRLAELLKVTQQAVSHLLSSARKRAAQTDE